MRLIDKEKFNERLDFLLYELNFYANKDMPGFNDERTRTIGTFFITHIHNMLNRTTEVDAVPMEWIKKYIEDHTYEMVNPKYVDDTYNYIQFTEKPLDYYLTVIPIQVKAMLADWKKENEID